MSSDAWQMARAGRYERRVGANTFTATRVRGGRWRLSCYGGMHYTLRVASLRAAKQIVANDLKEQQA